MAGAGEGGLSSLGLNLTGPAEREARIGDFLRAAGWGDAVRAPLAGDASSRRYLRLVRSSEPRGPERAVLMDAPPAAESAACPPGASEAERRALGYNALARLAGPDARAFIALAEHLIARGLSAPRVLAADPDAGLILLEDFGDALFSRVMAGGAPEEALYRAAIAALAHLHAQPEPETIGGRKLLSYDRAAALAETGLFLDWYMARRGKVSDAARAEWDAAWSAALEAANPARPVLVLRDYHADNLIWLPEREGPARAGLLDFQDALAGHPAYDVVSLTEDARRDVDPALAARLVDHYLDMTGADRAAFETGAAVWAGQRNAKILGIFVRLAVRDAKPRYLDLLPRVERLFANDLAHKALAPVRGWVRLYAPDLLEMAG